MKCLETRKRNGMTWRRYRTDDGRIVTTFELPTQVLRSVTTLDKIQSRIEGNLRAQESQARRKRIRALLADGWKPLAIASELAVGVRYVQQIKAGTR